eukprot:2904767-Karenia_brevis.AAC.1
MVAVHGRAAQLRGMACKGGSPCVSLRTLFEPHTCCWNCKSIGYCYGLDNLTPVSYTHLTLPTICSV